MFDLLSTNDSLYSDYVRHEQDSAPSVQTQQTFFAQAAFQPKFSFLMTCYNSDLGYLSRAVASIQRQVYQNWELCIADDASPNQEVQEYLKDLAAREPRVKIALRETNGHMSVASNTALALADGDFIVLVDHDDEIADTTLYWVMELLQTKPQLQLIYSDEDKIDAFGYRFAPYFKPDWSPELLLSQNFVSHLGIYRRERMVQIQGFRQGFEGSQDHDLVLRFTHQLPAEQIGHIRRVLYYWRTLPSSVAGAGLGNKPYALISGRNAIAERVQREMNETSDAAEVLIDTVMYRVQRNVPRPNPAHAHVIVHSAPSADAALQYARRLAAATYDGGELRVSAIGAGSEDRSLAMPPNSVLRSFRYWPESRWANANAGINALAALDDKAPIILLRCGAVPEWPHWLAQFRAQLLREGVGAVTAKLVTVANGESTVLHAGLQLDHQGVVRRSFAGFSATALGYFWHLRLTRNCTAASRDILATTPTVWQAVGGLDETLPDILADLQFALRLRDHHYRVIIEPWICFGRPNLPEEIDLTPEMLHDQAIPELEEDAKQSFRERWPAEIYQEHYSRAQYTEINDHRAWVSYRVKKNSEKSTSQSAPR